MTPPRAEVTGQLEMFPVPPTRPSKPVAKAPSGKPRWSKYRPKETVCCDDCFTILVAAKGEAPCCRPAHWKRTTTTGDLLLCSPHAQDRRLEDGLTPLGGASR